MCNCRGKFGPQTDEDEPLLVYRAKKYRSCVVEGGAPRHSNPLSDGRINDYRYAVQGKRRERQTVAFVSGLCRYDSTFPIPDNCPGAGDRAKNPDF